MGLSELPDDLLLEVFRRQDNLNAIYALSMACKSVNHAWVRVREHMIRNYDPFCATKSENNALRASNRWTLCTYCKWCMVLIPINFDAILVAHKCDGCQYPWAFRVKMAKIVLWRGPIHHLCMPLPCSENILRHHQIPRPNVYPYTQMIMT